MSLVILSSCNKEEESSRDSNYNPHWKVVENFYFQGVIKDTSANKSLINHTLFYGTCDSESRFDTIIDSTYFYHYQKIGSKLPCDPRPEFRLKDLSDSVILHYLFPASTKRLNDTVTHNILF